MKILEWLIKVNVKNQAKKLVREKSIFKTTKTIDSPKQKVIKTKERMGKRNIKSIFKHLGTLRR
jgi:hypothetical protein